MIATRSLFVLTEHSVCMFNALLWLVSHVGIVKIKCTSGDNPSVILKHSLVYLMYSKCEVESIFEVYMDDLNFVMHL